MPQSFLLAARDPESVEPLGIHYLNQVVKDEGWHCSNVLVQNDNFEPLDKMVRDQKPDLIGFHVWAGYHLPMLAAADRVRAQGIPVVMGGPYATYSHKQCEPHADWVVRASGFGLLRKILRGELKRGTHLDISARREMFPVPDRDVLYDAYPKFANSPIKSSFASVGCPYHCTYCHAPEYNALHGGFDLVLRSVNDIIAEAKKAMRWSTKVFYFQDDVFGFEIKKWLPEFTRRWPREVGIPFHCQMRLEMTRGPDGDKRLDLFAQAGCSGITLAIESGNEFLRNYVLFRPMPEELILAGCKKITDRGMTLRTEQIGMVPGSDIETDLGTLGLNARIYQLCKHMGWASVFSPYPGVNLGAIAINLGLWAGTNDDIRESFLDESILTHVAGGPRDIQKIVERLPRDQHKEILLRMRAVRNDAQSADVFYQWAKEEKIDKHKVMVPFGKRQKVGVIEYLSEAENNTYRKQGVRMQRLFNWLTTVPEGEQLGRTLVDLGDNEWSWERMGQVTLAHLRARIPADTLEGHVHALTREMHLDSPSDLPEVVAQNPHYFTRHHAGGGLAQKVVDEGLFGPTRSTAESLDRLGTLARHQFFGHYLYKTEKGPEPIAK